MSNKDNENKNSQQLFSEDITKKLVKNILDNEPENTTTKQPDFNIEYEDYDSQQFDEDLEEDFDEEYSYEEDYYEYNDDYNIKPSKKSQSKKINKNTKSQNQYRKNIEMYGKDFFEDDYDDYDDSSPSLIGRVISFSIIIVLTISTAFLAFSLKSTKKELTDAKAEIQELLDNKEDTENKLMEESLKSEVDALKTENENLKSQLNPNNSNTTNDTSTQTTSKNTSSSTNNNTTTNNSNNSSSSEYIVKEGDIIWNISKQVYGNGSYYQKILDANGLTENSILKPGQKLIIPNLN